MKMDMAVVQHSLTETNSDWYIPNVIEVFTKANETWREAEVDIVDND